MPMWVDIHIIINGDLDSAITRHQGKNYDSTASFIFYRFAMIDLGDYVMHCSQEQPLLCFAGNKYMYL